MDYTPFLDKYEELLKDLDVKCEETYKNLDFLPCRKTCAECCMQFFPVSFIEALYLNAGFKELPRQERRELVRKAEKIMQRLPSSEKLVTGSKEKIYKAQHEFADLMRGTGRDCPYLTEERMCKVYENRPHDCRVHGCSFDHSRNEVLGCFRFNDLPEIKDPKTKDELLDFDYLYPEIRTLDSMVLKAKLNPPEGVKVWYFASPLEPILQDYSEKQFEIDLNKYKEGDYVMILEY